MGFENTPVLRTERLILRKFNENDIEALFNIHRDGEVNRFLPWFPLRSVEEARDFFDKNYAEVYKKKRGYKYAICLKSDNVPVGYINIGMDEPHDLGYGLCKEFWHRGIVREAAKAVTERAKRDGIKYITATHDVKNPRSGNVMKSIGMKYKYSYEEQWQPKDITVIFRMYQLNFDGDDSRVYTKYWDDSEVHFVEKNI